MIVDYASLGRKIRQFRTEKGLTQSVLAEQAKIETSNISHIERGVSKAGLETLVRIALILGVTLDDLLCGTFPDNRQAFENDIIRITEDCSPKELRLLARIVKTVKTAMRDEKYDDTKI